MGAGEHRQTAKGLPKVQESVLGQASDERRREAGQGPRQIGYAGVIHGVFNKRESGQNTSILCSSLSLGSGYPPLLRWMFPCNEIILGLPVRMRLGSRCPFLTPVWLMRSSSRTWD